MKGTWKRARSCGNTSVEAVFAGDDDEPGRVRLDQLAHQRGDARHQFRFAVAPIGKEGVVGHVEKTRIRPRLGDLAEDREAAEARIEDQDGRCGCHDGCW